MLLFDYPFGIFNLFLYVVSLTGRKLVIIILEMVVNITSQLMRSKKDLINISFLILLIQVVNHCSMCDKELVTLTTIREHSRFCCGVCVAVVFVFRTVWSMSNVVSVSGLSIPDCPYGFLKRLFNMGNMILNFRNKVVALKYYYGILRINLIWKVLTKIIAEISILL